MGIKQQLENLPKQDILNIECFPDTPSYLTLKVLTKYFRTKLIKYTYFLTQTPSPNSNIYINLINNNSTKDQLSAINLDNSSELVINFDCKSCTTRELNRLVNGKWEFLTIFEYQNFFCKKNICRECQYYYTELFLLFDKKQYPKYLFHTQSTLYLSLFHDLNFIKNNKKDLNTSIKLYLAKSGISFADSLQKHFKNVFNEEKIVKKITPIEDFFVQSAEMKQFSSSKEVLVEKTNFKKVKTDKLDLKSNDGMDYYYKLTEQLLEVLKIKSIKKGFVLIKSSVCDSINDFLILYDMFKYVKNQEILFISECGYAINNTKYEINGVVINKDIIQVDKEEIERIVCTFNK